jgi:hypothetical protein
MAEKPAEATTSTVLAVTATAGRRGIGDAILIVADVSGSGQTTIAIPLGQRLRPPFEERGQLLTRQPRSHAGVLTFDLAADGRE